MRRSLLLAAVVIPPLIMAGFSAVHPPRLTVEAADRWQDIHTYLIVVFPLIALGPWLVARQVSRLAAIPVLVAAYIYATFYTALDILAGVGGGAIKGAEAGGLGIIFPIAGDFEEIGGIALVVACALGAGVAMHATGWLRGLLPSALVVFGGYTLWQHHIFHPDGVYSGLALAAGWGAFAFLISPKDDARLA